MEGDTIKALSRQRRQPLDLPSSVSVSLLTVGTHNATEGRRGSALEECRSVLPNFCASPSRAIFVGGLHVASLRQFRIVSKTLN